MIKSNPDVYERGFALMKQLHGDASGEALINSMKDICPDFITMAIEWSFGSIFSREGLDIKTRELAVIASCVTLGSVEPQLRAHIEAALNANATKQEIVEVILQTALYAGFARSVNSLNIAKEVFAEKNI